MHQLARTSDFSAVKAALEKYQKFPKEDVKPALDILQERYDDLVEMAKEQLRDLGTVTDPLQIDQTLARFEAYSASADDPTGGGGGPLAEERKVVVARRDKIIEDAKSELVGADGAVTDAGAEGGTRAATLADMQKIYDKYGEFPDVQEERAQLKTKLDSLVGEIQEKLREALASHDIAMINEAMKLHVGAGNHLETSFARLIKQQHSMMTTMRNKMASSLASHNIDNIIEVLLESEPYGESMVRWRLALEERKQTTIKTVIAELDIMKASNDSLSVSIALEKFEKFGEKFEEAKPV